LCRALLRNQGLTLRFGEGFTFHGEIRDDQIDAIRASVYRFLHHFTVGSIDSILYAPGKVERLASIPVLRSGTKAFFGADLSVNQA
jgi:hypothetical protein